MREKNINVVPNANVIAVEKSSSDGTLSVLLEDGSVHHGYETVLMAVGRQPLVENMKLANAGVTTNVKRNTCHCY
jgi:pyruvate/2-oxoglutarate dehydrogenase complex dihydrolipoamide dehydrogenase (E3) component